MIITVKPINISSPHRVTIFCVMRAPKIYSLSKFSVFNAIVLTVVIMLYDRSLDLFILHNCNFASSDQHLPISYTCPPFPTPGNHHSILCFYVTDFFRFHI